MPHPTNPNGPDDRLIAAILAGDAAAAGAALIAGAQPRAVRHYEMCWDREWQQGEEPVLLCAARQGHAALVELLLQHDADPDAHDSLSGRTPLIAASARGDVRSVLALLKAKAALDAVDGRSGDTAFAAAIDGGHAEIAALLAAAGATATARALEQACHRGRIDLAEVCVRHGASLTQSGGLVVAARAGHLAMVRWLLAQCAELAQHGPEALCEAANAARADVVAFLLEHGVPSDCCTSYGWPPLHLAAWNGDGPTLLALLRAGADPRAVDREGLCALDHARAAGKAANVALLERA